MKRANNLFDKIISFENLWLAIEEVNASHRWTKGHHPNRTTMWVETTKAERIRDLREMLVNGFQPSEPKQRRVYDQAAGKWRDICEPKLWPDQYVHHALIQVLTPIMMRGMDKWCCGSIKRRGTHYGAKRIKVLMKNDVKSTKYCMELDIRQFYKSIKPKYVMRRMRRLIKCGRTLALIEILVKNGLPIGYYFSQWFANTLLQPLDRIIRESGLCNDYERYMDNFTIFGRNKRNLRKLFLIIQNWLSEIELEIKSNWQIFRATKRRLPNALGYRYGRGYTYARKGNLFRLKRKLAEAYKQLDNGGRIAVKRAQGIMSRLGQLKHCNSKKWKAEHIRQNSIKMFKNIIRKYQRTELMLWNTALEIYMAQKSCSQNPVLAASKWL